MEYQLKLDSSFGSHYRGRKSSCPACGKKTFVKYINTSTQEYLPDEYGRCERINSCGYHESPYSNIPIKTISQIMESSENLNKVSKIHPEIFDKFKKSGKSSNLHFHLEKLFPGSANKLMKLYNVTAYKDGYCIFWQKDYWGNFKTGKIMIFERNQFRRDKTAEYKFDFVHRAMIRNGIIKDYAENQQCFFGEHLLRYRRDVPVAIVEGEKTALIMAMYEPGLIWISAGSLTLKYIWEDRRNIDKFKDREVRVYPDTNGVPQWRERTSILKHMGINAALYTDWYDDRDLGNGEDIADYYLETDETGLAIDDGIPLILGNPLQVWNESNKGL